MRCRTCLELHAGETVCVVGESGSEIINSACCHGVAARAACSR